MRIKFFNRTALLLAFGLFSTVVFANPDIEHWTGHNIALDNTIDGAPIVYRSNLVSPIVATGASQIILAGDDFT